MNDIKAIFDIGNDTIKAIVFWKDWDEVRDLEKQSETALWMRKGKIIDAEAFTNVLNKIIESFVKKLGGEFIEKVYVGVSHPEIITQRIVEGKRIMNDEVMVDDLEHLSKIVTDISSMDNYETIKIVPVAWILDGKREKDPIWLKCKKLELMADVFLIPKNYYNGIIDAFDKIGLEISDIIPNILAVSEIVLDCDHKDLGSILVDIGKNQTSYVVYEDGYSLWYGVIPVGGENVTKDIAIGMQVDIKDAEDIKRNIGTAVIDEETSLETSLDIHFLTEIISARYEQVFLKINTYLESLEKDGRLPWGVFLIGGGAKVKNLPIYSGEVFKIVSNYGKDQILNLWELSSNIQYLNVLWCYYWSTKYVDESRKWWNFSWVWGKIKEFLKKLF